MRVAHLTCVYPPYGGGIGEVARQYAALLTAEHQVSVITPKYTPGMTFINTPGVSVIAKRPVFSWGKAAWLARLGRLLSRFDVIHLHYPFFGVHDRLAHLPLAAKLVITYHMMPQATGLKGKLMQLSRRYSSQLLAQRASLLTVATQDYLQSVALPEMGQPDKWRVLPFGVDDRFSPGEPSEILTRRLNIRYGEQIILFVGTLDQTHYFKGLDILLEAVAELGYQNWRLIVVGAGEKRRYYEQRAQTLKLSRRVNFVGYVPTAELPDYYRLANIFVLPSINEAEAFGLAALQAMASGLPVIASRLPGVRELVSHGDTGLLTEPGNALALAAALDNLLVVKNEQKRLGVNGFKKVEENYRWSVIGRKLLEMYRQL